MSSHSFPKSRRLLKSAGFERVFSHRRSTSDRWLVVYACDNDLDQPRLGLVVSRKVGTAVQRNRWKRCLREAFRLSQRDLPALDFVVIPKPGPLPSLEEVRQSLVALARRLSGPLRKNPRAASE